MGSDNVPVGTALPTELGGRPTDDALWSSSVDERKEMQLAVDTYPEGFSLQMTEESG